MDFACWVSSLAGYKLLRLGKYFILVPEGGVPGGIRTRGCRTAAQRANKNIFKLRLHMDLIRSLCVKVYGRAELC